MVFLGTIYDFYKILQKNFQLKNILDRPIAVLKDDKHILISTDEKENLLKKHHNESKNPMLNL